MISYQFECPESLKAENQREMIYLYCPELVAMISELEQTCETCEQKQAEGQTCNQYFYFRSIVFFEQINN